MIYAITLFILYFFVGLITLIEYNGIHEYNPQKSWKMEVLHRLLVFIFWPIVWTLGFLNILYKEVYKK